MRHARDGGAPITGRRSVAGSLDEQAAREESRSKIQRMRADRGLESRTPSSRATPQAGERQAAKAAIGRAAAVPVRNGDSIILDSDSTVHEVAVALREHHDLTVSAAPARAVRLRLASRRLGRDAAAPAGAGAAGHRLAGDVLDEVAGTRVVEVSGDVRLGEDADEAVVLDDR